jgi:molybdopterin-guanine dinucleotide biosynthesis protein A
MGGSKATVALHGRPLISYPLEAMWRALGAVAIIAKPDTELPDMPGVTVWIEPEQPHHPVIGLVHALEMAGKRPVVLCAADLPFVTPRLVRRLAQGARDAQAVITVAGDVEQPLLGWYHPSCLDVLQGLNPRDRMPLRECVEQLQPGRLNVGDPEILFNVNTPDDLLMATAMLDRRPEGT